MPSSPARSTTAVSTRQESLRELLARAPDPRDPRGVRHPAAAILAVGIAAVVAGACSFTAIGEWAADAGGQVLAELGITGACPDEATFRRLFAWVDADVLDRLLGAWMWTATTVTSGRRVIAIDGKSLRGATGSDGLMPHLVAAYDHTAGAVLGQVAVTAKSNEIPAVPDLLACFDLTGAVITVDAMHTQTDTARTILAGGGDYVFTCKKNQPGLHAQITQLPWKKVPAHTVTTRAHGRRVTRTIKVIDAPDWIAFTGAAQIAQVRRTLTRNGKMNPPGVSGDLLKRSAPLVVGP